jgi:hypothetical protein
MKNVKKHLSTDNYTILKKEYLDSVVLPSLKRAKKENQQICKIYNIAGKNIQLCFYSKALADRVPLPFKHHALGNEKDISLTIHLWDGVNQDEISTPWTNTDYFEQETNTKKEIYDGFFGAYLGEQTLNLYDKENSTAYFWTKDGETLPDWITAAPLRTILNWFFSENNIHLVHGGAVGVGNKAILLSARGGSGKSTTSLSCLLSGMNYLADDYVGIEIKEKTILHSLFSSVKITPDTLPTFPDFKERIWNKTTFGGSLDNGKAVIFLRDLFPKQLIHKAELSAIFIPIIKKETRIVPASKLEAMLALAPTTIFQLPLAGADKMKEFKKIITSVPCYFLELGPEISNIPEVIKKFLKEQK